MTDKTFALYGRMLSPFTRRVAIWARLQGWAVDHRPIQVVGPEFEALTGLFGTGRVPLAILPSGERLVDSFAICDWLESVAPEPARLLPQAPDARRAATQALALAHGAAEKAVALLYETQRRPEDKRWADWAARLAAQTEAALGLLEDRLPEAGFMGGATPNGADVAATIAHDFVDHARVEGLGPPPAKLAALAARANEITIFAETHPRHG